MAATGIHPPQHHHGLSSYLAIPLLSPFLARSRELFSQLTLHEISGSVGDLGTFVPLVVALARQDAIALGPTLFWAGFSNVVTGFVWDVPCAVQPMKAIASIALAQNLNHTQVSAAGVWMGLFMVLLGITNGIEVVNWLVPTPVVSGIQMGVGINLAIRGLIMIQGLPSWWGQLDCRGLALVMALLCLYWLREPTSTNNNVAAAIAPDSTHDNNHEITNADEHPPNNIINSNSTNSRRAPSSSSSSSGPSSAAPVGLYLFGLGMLLALIQLFWYTNTTDDEVISVDQIHDKTNSTTLSSGTANNETTTNKYQWPPVVTWALGGATLEDWKQGLLEGALPQLPLTTLNSVVSLCCLAHTLYPEKRRHQHQQSSTSSSEDAVISRRQVSWSVGLMNLVLCPLGAMPCCHGAGGLAGQHKFGARHGAAVVFLGLNKMAVAVFLGGSLLRILEALPTSILGLMLVVCGHELAVMGWIILLTKQQQSTATMSEEPAGQTGVRSIQMRKGIVIALLTVVVDIGLHKTHYAALAGWVAYMIYGDGVQDYAYQMRGHRRNVDMAQYSPIVQSNEECPGSRGLDPLHVT